MQRLVLLACCAGLAACGAQDVTEVGGGSSSTGSAQAGTGGSSGGAGSAGSTGGVGGSTGARGGSSGGTTGRAGTSGGRDGGWQEVGDGGATGGLDAGVANWTGISFVVDGGQIPTLDFGDVGDTRPPFYDFAYPAQVIGEIYSDLAGLSPPIAFVVSTGDYMFADPFSSDAVTQAQTYVDAGALFPRQIYPAMGNHECDLSTSNDNCFGQTTNPNYNAYLTNILGGFGLPDQNPYFVVIYASSDVTRPWTAKFIYSAPDWWDTSNNTQDTWTQQVLAQPTTYTFFVRHQPTNNSAGAPGVAPTDDLLQEYPFTLKLTGHSHSYDYDQTNREIINGLGGAALDTGYNGTFGYVVCRQRQDMAIQCSLFDYDTNAPSTEPNAVLAVEPDGTATTPD